jgi:HEAT repeat protein
VSGIVEALPNIKHAKTVNGTVHALKNLATHHLNLVVEELLKVPTLPHPEHVVKCFQGIAKDPNLVAQMLAHVCDAANNSVLYKEQGKFKISQHKGKKLLFNYSFFNFLLAMAATAALGDILGEPAVADVLRARYAPIMGTLLMRVGTSVGQKYMLPDAKKSKEPADSIAPELVVSAIRAAIRLGEEEQIETQLDNMSAWSMFADEQEYTQAIQLMVRGMCGQHPEHMSQLFAFLSTFLQGNYEGQRLAAAAALAEMVAHCSGAEKTQLLDGLINTLLGALTDSALKIMCLRGLSNVVGAGADMVNRYSQTILDALLSNVDSQEEPVSLEAMTGLAKVFDLVSEEKVAPILVNLCNRVKPAFEAQTPSMRAAAFQLFGSLWHFGQKGAKDVFYAQIHNNLPIMLLHLNDESDEVKASVKRAFRCLGPLMRSQEIDDLFQGPNFDPQRNLRYNMFLDEVCKLMVHAYPDKVNYIAMQAVGSFKSAWNWKKANAVLLVGFLLGNLPMELRNKSNLNPGMVAAALIQLLQDKSPSVRKATSETMALLHSYKKKREKKKKINITSGGGILYRVSTFTFRQDKSCGWVTFWLSFLSSFFFLFFSFCCSLPAKRLLFSP